MVLDGERTEHPASSIRHQASAKKILARNFPFRGKNGIYSLASHCRICQRKVFSKLFGSISDWLKNNYIPPGTAADKRAALGIKVTNVNFALTIGMLKLRRRLRSSRPVRRPLLTWEVLHIPVAPCLSGWRDHIRR
jgi:hypothetical protein